MKIQTTAAAALLGAAAGAFQAQAGDAVQWRVEDGGNGHWYHGIVPTPLVTWFEAKLRSESLGGHLVTFTSTDEHEFVYSRIAQFPEIWHQHQTCGCLSVGPWIGMRRTTDWQWVTGEPVSFTSWHPGEPWEGSPKDFVRFFHYATPLSPAPLWDNYLNGEDLQDVSTPTSFIVEWETDCNSDGIIDYGQCHDGTLPDYNGNNIPDCCEQGVQCTVGNYPVQWRVEDGGNGHWYRFIPVNLIGSWSSANEAAGQVGGHLATITTPAELGFVELLSACVGCPGWGPSWAIGGIQNRTSPEYAEPTGGWQWVTGENWSWSPWAPGEPNNSGGSENFLYLHCNLDGFNDGGDPSNGCMAAIIEWSADCNNDNIVDYGQILNSQLADTNANNIPDCCEPGNSCCVGDIYVNHIIDGGDLGVLLSEWGVVTPTTNSDLNRDGFVNGADLGMLLANWGPCGG
jgi:hypothetical protein